MPNCLPFRTDPPPGDPEGGEPPLTSAWVECGRITGVFGIRGELKIASYTEPAERLLDYRPWMLSLAQGQPQPVHPVGSHRRGSQLVVALDGLTDRTRAESLVGGALSVPRTCFPTLPEGQFYWVDLVGLKVVNEEGVPLGRVTDLIRGPAGDCLAVSGVEDQLIPFSWQTTVLAVDLKSRRIQVRSTR